jgi:hypothetical protein
MTSHPPPLREEPAPEPSTEEGALASLPGAAQTREPAPAEPVDDGDVGSALAMSLRRCG